MNVLLACMYVCMLSVQGGQKTVYDPLELTLWIVASHHMGTGNQTLDVSKSKCSQILNKAAILYWDLI